MLNQKVINYIFCCVIGMVTLFLQAAYPQDPKFSKFTEEEGLPGNDVYDVLVADDGLLWFATDNGVCRYNGIEFINFNVASGLPTNSTLKLYKDAFGRIWFLAYNGMLSYYDQGEFVIYPYNDTIVKYFRDNYFNKIFVDSAGGLLMSPRQGGYAYIDKEGNINAHPAMRPNNRDSCYLLFEDKGNDYFLTILSRMLGSYYKEGHLFYNDSTYYIKVAFTHREFQRHFIETGKNAYLVSYRNNIYYIKDHKLIAQRSFNDEILSVFVDDKDKLWVSVKYDNGVYMFEDHLFRGSGVHFLDGYTITSITQDKEGDYWLGTEGHGVFFSPSFDFSHFTLPGDERALNVMALAISGNRLWFTSRDKHLYSGSLSQGKLIKIRQVDIGEPYDWVRHICIDSDGYLWLPSTKYLRYDPAGFPHPPDTILNSNFLCSGPDETIIVASTKLGIYKHGELQKFIMPDTSRRIYSVYQEEDQDIWIGTLYGLYVYKNDRSYFKGSLSPILRERISSITKLKEMMVIGTSAHGLVFLYNDSVTDHLTEENGLIGNTIKSLYAQNDTILWVGTKDGLNRIVFTPGYDDYNIESYGQSDGLPSNEINSIRMHDGFIWLATGTGLVSFDPANLKPHLVPPLIQISSIQINGRDTCILDYYSLAHDQNDIRINFSGISYRLGENLRYRYMLSNYNDEIIQTKNKWANFPNLPPGDYTFFVNVGNVHGIWNDSPKNIQFRINKHFTQTIWFMILLIILSSGTLVLIWAFFQKQKKIKENARYELVKMEQKLFRLQMNPHFVFNALLAIQGFMYMNKPREAGRYLTAFAKLIRHTLYGSSEEYITLDKEIEALQYYLELQRLRFSEKFDFIIHVDDELIPESTEIPPLMIQPFLENAIEHGLQHKKKQGKLKLDISIKDDCLMVEVEDNGIGREKAMKMQKKKGKLHKSMGLEIINKRMESMNKITLRKIQLEIIDLHGSDGASTGTLVIIYIPYKNV